MAIPTAGEEAIYKNAVRTYEVRVQVEIDENSYTTPWTDAFNDASIDGDRWRQFLPSGWGTITEAGGVLTVDAGTDSEQYPPYADSKNDAGRVFPTDSTEDFTLTAIIRFPVITGYVAPFRVLSFDRTLLEIGADSGSGLYVNLDGTLLDTFGLDTSWNTWVLEYASSTQTYTVKLNGGTEGSAVIDDMPVQIVIGYSDANQGDPGVWSQIAVDSITVTGTTESSSTPAWATPFTEDSITWSYLPTSTDGEINVHKNNNVDRCQVRALNQDNSSQGIYSGTSFFEKRMRVKTRVSDDAGNWTDWKVRFRGRIAEARFDIRDGMGELVLECQDEHRYALGGAFIVRSYGDFDTTIDGIVNNQTVAQILADLFGQAGLTASDYSIDADANGTLIPKTFNLVDVSARDAAAELVESIIWTMYVNPDDGVIQALPFDWASGASPDYVMRVTEEIENIRRVKNASDAVGQSVVAAQNTAGLDVTLNYPASAIPAGARIDRFHTLAAQSYANLEDNDLAKERWQRMNRGIGAIEVLMSCQNWIEHDLHVAVEDGVYLSLAATKTWVIDGWRERWNATGYTVNVQLADPDFSSIIDEGL